MLRRIHWGEEKYKGGQEELVYLVSNAQRVAEAGLDFAFTDRHAVRRYAAFSNTLDDLTRIDWRLMIATWWDRIPEYPDRKERKQAEFMVHGFLPWELVGFLAVMTPQMQQRVEAILTDFPASMRRPVRVEPDWYH